MTRRQKIRRRRAVQLGTLAVIVVAALLIVPPLLGKVAAHAPTEEVVLQFDNSMVLHNGELARITENDGTALAPYRDNGVAMLPMRWLAETAGLSVEWEPESKAITLAQPEGGLSVVMTAGSTEMRVGDETVALDAPPILKDGVAYVPARAVSEAFGWNIASPAEAGSYIFLDNGSKPAEPTEQQIAAAKEKLGPSRDELRSQSLIARSGSGTILWNGTEVELKTGENHYLGAVSQDGVDYLPVEATFAAIGGAVEAADNGYTVTFDGKSVSLQGNKVDGKAIAEDGAALFTDEDGVAYLPGEMLAAVTGMQYDSLSGGVFALTAAKLDGFTDQETYMTSLGAQLPDKRPDIPDAKGYIALTFDDGPTGGATGLTAKLLDGLKERGAHATFFMCGYRIKDFHTHMKRYLEEGHELGNHTMDHPLKFSKLAPEEIYNQVDSNSALIESYTGQRPTAIRPVGGAVTDNVKEQMKKLGLPIINWSVDTLDWKYRDAARIKKVIVNEARDGDIVLMHDLHQPTVDGVLAAIDELQAQGYAFVTVHELAQIKGVTLEPGTVYTDIKG